MMMCEVAGCNAPVRIMPGVGVICDAGHAYHTARMRTVSNPTLPPPARLAPPSPVRMTFGVHKGEMIEDLPSDYIAWALANLAWLKGMPAVREEMMAQMEMRAGRGVVRRKRETETGSGRHASTRPGR